MHAGRFTRRGVLRAGAGLSAAAALGRAGGSLASAAALLAAGGLRKPDSLPDPTRPAGVPTAALPFDHIVIVMMENHSFDDHLGMLPVRGQPLADGFTFDAAGRPVNSNPVPGGYIVVERARSLCTPADSASQGWNDTHAEIDGGRMDGFARLGPASLIYWDEEDLPFYYSLAKTFCLANRWFCSAPCQTYPNRRFLLAGTAFGLISTDTSSITQNPPNGTIVDRLEAYGISWKDYFTDVPATGVIESIPQNHPLNLAPISEFFLDCASGSLPAVSWVDSDIGVAPVVTGELPAPFSAAAQPLSRQNEDEENGDISLGENFVAGVVDAVLKSPSWPRILLVWTYDEHGGSYDHVPPPAAIPPDDIRPRIGPKDAPGGYDIYGPRVPAVVVSGYAKPHAVTNVVHDHTSVLAMIEAKWNLPAMTFRDANAATLADFLDTRVRFPEPPILAAPGDLGRSEQTCTETPPVYPVHKYPPARVMPSPAVARGLVTHFYGRRHHYGGVLVELRLRSGTLTGLTVELERRGHLVARAHVGHLGVARHRVVLRTRSGGEPPRGRYTLLVRAGTDVLVRRSVRAG
jgi:phospholipase C